MFVTLACLDNETAGKDWRQRNVSSTLEEMRKCDKKCNQREKKTHSNEV